MFLKTSQYSQEAVVLESLYNKVAGLQTPTQVFSCEYCEIYKNSYFEEDLGTVVSIFFAKNIVIPNIPCFYPDSTEFGNRYFCEIGWKCKSSVDGYSKKVTVELFRKILAKCSNFTKTAFRLWCLAGNLPKFLVTPFRSVLKTFWNI